MAAQPTIRVFFSVVILPNTEKEQKPMLHKNNESKQVCLADTSHLDVKSDATTKLMSFFVPDQECVCN